MGLNIWVKLKARIGFQFHKKAPESSSDSGVIVWRCSCFKGVINRFVNLNG